MKNSISNIWLLGLVVLFIMTFAGFLAVTVSYSAAFKMRNEMITIIEKHKGISDKSPKLGSNTKIPNGGSVYLNPGTLQAINAYLHGSGYKVKGSCETKNSDDGKWYGINTLDYLSKINPEEVRSKTKKYFYCVTKHRSHYSGDHRLNANYYEIRLFFKLDIPVLGDIFTFKIEGTTNDIYQSDDNLSY